MSDTITPERKTRNQLQTPRHKRAKHALREVWLDEAMGFIRPLFKQAGYTVPSNVRVGVGWPSRGGMSKKKQTIGQAWCHTCSKDDSHEIIISITQADPIRVLGILIHEVIHVTIGIEHGHKKPFVDAMKAVGLTGKPTATTESPELVATLRDWVKELGLYPHAALDASSVPKQSTRLIKVECPDDGFKFRTTQKWIAEFGIGRFVCPCGQVMEVHG